MTEILNATLHITPASSGTSVALCRWHLLAWKSSYESRVHYGDIRELLDIIVKTAPPPENPVPIICIVQEMRAIFGADTTFPRHVVPSQIVSIVMTQRTRILANRTCIHTQAVRSHDLMDWTSMPRYVKSNMLLDIGNYPTLYPPRRKVLRLCCSFRPSYNTALSQARFI